MSMQNLYFYVYKQADSALGFSFWVTDQTLARINTKKKSVTALDKLNYTLKYSCPKKTEQLHTETFLIKVIPAWWKSPMLHALIFLKKVLNKPDYGLVLLNFFLHTNLDIPSKNDFQVQIKPCGNFLIRIYFSRLLFCCKIILYFAAFQ